MTSPTDSVLDNIQAAAEGRFTALSVPLPQWHRETTELTGAANLSAEKERVFFRRTGGNYGPPLRTGGDARPRLARLQVLTAEIRGRDFETTEALLDGIAWALRKCLGSALQFRGLTWAEMQTSSRGCACTLTFAFGVVVRDPAGTSATVEVVSMSGSLTEVLST